ncbi:hypothetical protein [Curtobacterium sp. MCBD17_040]|uniref:hypothetical protein n=1 Tax=Curtobacterium sp. MCBD17_040 TaxID=2175674 RepID=UPI0011B7A2DB|nr:hypothetical protein [Curtobacterium sp. MCBD17_040]WIB65310.1 hypothetical protein DEI94_18055 [Curtobacterium sp. MCBD17_040]
MTTASIRRKDTGAAPTTTAGGAVLSGGAFAAKSHEADDIDLAVAADGPFGDVPVDLPDDVRALAGLLANVYRHAPDRRAIWLADETFTCDGGALATKLAADRLGIDATLHVGLYWHTDPELRANILGYDPDDYTDRGWDDVLDEVSEMMDEHHHWVTIRASNGVEYLIDPNGPVRGEDHILRLDDAARRYKDGAPNFVYDPEEDPNLIADEMYPRLREQVDTAVAALPRTPQS